MVFWIVVIFMIIALVFWIAYLLGYGKSKAGIIIDCPVCEECPTCEEPDIPIIRPMKTFLYSNASEATQEELVGNLRVASSRNLELPDNFDVREKWPDSIGDPLDQGNCGSCWAFASSTAVTDRIRISEPQNEELRERFKYTPFIEGAVGYVTMNTLNPYELVNCDTCADKTAGEECSMGCDGGYIGSVYKFMSEKGVTSIMCSPPDCDPHTMDEEDCPCVIPNSCRKYTPSSVYAVYSSSDTDVEKRRKIMEDLYTYGPITTGMTIYNSFVPFFSNNPIGVYKETDKPPGDLPDGGHAINIMGWGVDEEGTNYWLMKNSWGVSWGDNGFFKIQWDFGDLLAQIPMAARIG